MRPMAKPSRPSDADDPLPATDRQLEGRVNTLQRLLRADPRIVSPDSLVWMLGYILSQRERYAGLMDAAADELEELGSDCVELVALLRAYAALGRRP